MSFTLIGAQIYFGKSKLVIYNRSYEYYGFNDLLCCILYIPQVSLHIQ